MTNGFLDSCGHWENFLKFAPAAHQTLGGKVHLLYRFMEFTEGDITSERQMFHELFLC